jgi:hypothetical protein
MHMVFSANLQVRAFSLQTALVRANEKVNFLALSPSPGSGSLGGQALSPVKFATFSMCPAYLGGQSV